MTLENQHSGSEYGLEKKSTRKGIKGFWYFINEPGNGYDTYEDVYQTALAIQKRVPGDYRIVVYDYDGSKRKNVRILTAVTPLEPWIEKTVDEMINIAPTKEDEEVDLQDYFDDTTDWCAEHPGDKTFTCPFCGIYEAGKARCNECEEDKE